MDKIVGNIYSMYNYGKFKKLSNNRSVTENRLGKLIASFSTREVINPIVVNKNMEIIDGQHRFDVKRRLNRPIYYIVDPEATIDDCRRMNKYNEPWSLSTFVESYAKSGNDNYVRLLGACNATKFSPGRVLRLANKAKSNYKKTAKNPVEDGDLIFTFDDAKTVLKVKTLADEISEALLTKERKNDAFYTAVKVMTEFEGYNHEWFLKNCKKERSKYTQMSGLENQLAEFSRIYNRNIKKASNKLYFEDYMRNRGYNVRNYDDISSFRKLNQEDVSTLN